MASPTSRTQRHVLVRIYVHILLALVVLLQAFIDGVQWIWHKLTGKHGTAAQATSGSGSTPAPAKHVAVVFAEPEEAAVPCNTVATILEWCYKADMDLVKLYDPAGFLKRREAELRESMKVFLMQLQDEFPSTSLPTDGRGSDTGSHGCKQISVHVGWHWDVPTDTETDNGNLCNKLATASKVVDVGGEYSAAGTASRPLMKILLLSAEDAYVPVLESVKHAAACGEEPIKTSNRSHQQAGQEMSARIAQQAGWEAAQEPQLIMVYSAGPLTLAGFPPWQARTAEILHMGPAHQATLAGFQAALSKFSHTLQRFGR